MVSINGGSNSDDAKATYAINDTDAYMIASNDFNHIAVRIDNSTNVHFQVLIDCNVSGDTSHCESSIYGFSDSDGTNVHSAYTLNLFPRYTIYFSLDMATGLTDTTLKRTNSENQELLISSLYVDGNGVAWISLYSDLDYSELISYDRSSGESTTYKQNGADYRYQYVNSSNSNYWYGITFEFRTTEVKVSSMDSIDILSVSTSGGLVDTSFSLVNYANTITAYSFSDASATTQSISVSDADVNVDVTTGTAGTTGSGSSKPQEDTTAKAAATTVITITIATIVISLIASSVSSAVGSRGGGDVGAGGDAGGGENSSSDSKGSKQSLWAIINLYQEILLLPMLGTYLGNDFHFYITEFELALFDFQFLESAEVPVFESGVSIIDQIDYDQPDELFIDNEFESGSAFYNCFQILKVMILVFIFNFGYLIYRWIIHKKKPEREFWYKIDKWFANFFHYTIYLRLLIES